MPDLFLNEMTEAQLGRVMRDAADLVAGRLPRGSLFVLLAFDTDPGIAQYISNCEREDMFKTLRETADRIELRQIRERVRFPD